MPSIAAVDETTGRKFYLDDPDDLKPGEEVTFILSLHGGGSVGAWQKAYFPAADYKDSHRLVIATPSAATKEPSRRWVGEADDAHLHNIVDQVFAKYGDRIRAFWLAGHSQGGMTSNRLLTQDDFFKDRVDGWLSLSGGRIGPAPRAEGFSVPLLPGQAPMTPPARPPGGPSPDADLSFIFTVGEHEIASLPETSPWAEKYGAGPRERRPDVVDTEPGQIYDTLRDGRSNRAWGLKPRPGTAEVWVYPGARDGRVIADVVRRDKGHTEGLEPKVTEALLDLIVAAPGGKAKALYG